VQTHAHISLFTVCWNSPGLYLYRQSQLLLKLFSGIFVFFLGILVISRMIAKIFATNFSSDLSVVSFFEWQIISS